ncbi:hypothetical protein [Streptomyces chartreusis]|uniref:hypothetical protein n=1 Tax=Streptomyces chartreusis TaxID=1969 RepID=UPI0035DD7CAA
MQYLIDQARVFRARAAAHTLHLDGLARYHRPRAMFIADEIDTGAPLAHHPRASTFLPL